MTAFATKPHFARSRFNNKEGGKCSKKKRAQCSNANNDGGSHSTLPTASNIERMVKRLANEEARMSFKRHFPTLKYDLSEMWNHIEAALMEELKVKHNK